MNRREGEREMERERFCYPLFYLFWSNRLLDMMKMLSVTKNYHLSTRKNIVTVFFSAKKLNILQLKFLFKLIKLDR